MNRRGRAFLNRGHSRFYAICKQLVYGPPAAIVHLRFTLTPPDDLRNLGAMKILLVNPAQTHNYMAKTANTFLVPQNTLAHLAALTPDCDVEIQDELVETIDFDTKADLVGITVLTDNAVRAYQVADAFRARGKTVVMGGAHATAVPAEALAHADAVVAGEAEDLWRKLVAEAQSGKPPSGLYHSKDLPSLVGLPHPRRDLLRAKKGYMPVDMVQTTRGCPYRCEFCSVPGFSGMKFRKRPVDDVIRELEACGKIIFFIDDILTGDPRYAKELFERMVPLKKRWISQVTMNTADRPEVVKAMGRSGCAGIFVGVESVDQQTLKGMHKPHNKAHKYLNQIKTFQDAGVPVLGGFVFGFDEDDDGVFDRTLEFLFQSKIDVASFTILTPLPGTPLYDRWKAEKRLRYEQDWWLHRDWTQVVFEPKGMSAERLRRGWMEVAVEFYGAKRIAGRVGRNLLTQGPLISGFVMSMNLSYRQAAWNLARTMGMVG